MSALQTRKRDFEMITTLVDSWRSTRIWAEQLLVEALGLSDPSEVLQSPHRGRHKIGSIIELYRARTIRTST